MGCAEGRGVINYSWLWESQDLRLEAQLLSIWGGLRAASRVFWIMSESFRASEPGQMEAILRRGQTCLALLCPPLLPARLLLVPTHAKGLPSLLRGKDLIRLPWHGPQVQHTALTLPWGDAFRGGFDPTAETGIGPEQEEARAVTCQHCPGGGEDTGPARPVTSCGSGLLFSVSFL